MDRHTARLIDIIFPRQKVSLTPPSVVIQLIARLEKGKFFLNTSGLFSSDFDIKTRQNRKQPLFHHADFLSTLIIHVDLMPQRKKFRFYEILWVLMFIIDVIGIGP